MRYFVETDPTPGAAPLLVDVTELPTGRLDVRVGGRLVDIDLVAVGAQLSMRIDGRLVDLTTEGSPPELGAVMNGHRSYVRVESERQRAAAAAKKGGGGSEKVLKSPMPGRIVKVHVKKGDHVEPGQALLVVEAMKMENEIKAKLAATIAEVHVKAGDTVEGSAKLVTLA